MADKLRFNLGKCTDDDGDCDRSCLTDPNHGVCEKRLKKSMQVSQHEKAKHMDNQAICGF